MIEKKYISKIIIVIVALAVLFCLAAGMFANEIFDTVGGAGVTMAYESRLFDTEKIIQIDIQMDEDAWNAMLDNALAEEFVPCNVIINGQRINNVAIRPKGNTSLSSIAMNPDTERYSFKLEFDHYVKGQTCFGLDKLILNNNYADATNMKEAIVYDMYKYLGAEASLYNYAQVSVNGAYWGIYLALEAVEDSFLLRNFGTQSGEMYKPDSMNMGNRDEEGDSPGGERPDGEFAPPGDFDGESEGGSRGDSSGEEGESAGDSEGENAGDSEGASNTESSGERFVPENTPEFDGDSPGGPGGGPGGGGANLNYIDDDPDSYTTIWEGEITNTGTADHRRVVEALKNISEGNDLERYMNVDNILRYMAVHVFSVNMDSLSGGMAHNYYLYEYNGQLNMFPWDYNLSFGGMNMGGGFGESDAASDMINDAIDSPFNSTKFFDALLEDEEYLDRYHEYLRKLSEEYVIGGIFDKVYHRIRNQIDDLVKTDPTAFYNYEEYEAGAEMLYKTVMLRAESIECQLNGTIPSTDSAQRRDPSTLIKADGIDINTMGTFGMGGGPGDSDGFPGSGEAADSDSAQGAGEVPAFNDD